MVWKADRACYLHRTLNDPSGLLGNGNRYADLDEVSPRGGIRGLGVDYEQDDRRRLPEVKPPAPLKVSPRGSPAPRAPSRDPPANEIAPWLSEGPELNTHGLTSATLFGGPSKPEKSPSLRPGTGRTGHSVSPDPMFRGEERNPSTTSATTLGSQNSWSKASSRRQTAGPNKQIAPFLGDEGQMSSKSSETSLPNMLQREQTNSSRHSSTQNNNADSGMHSPTSSRPRTPPSSDVVPWLFQDFKVRPEKLLLVIVSMRWLDLHIDVGINAFGRECCVLPLFDQCHGLYDILVSPGQFQMLSLESKTKSFVSASF